MFRSAKTFVKKIKVLTDPEPSFVSLVSAGANKTPFRSVKSEEDAMSVLNSKKSDGLEFQSVIFKGESYETAEACHDWLSEGGITEYDLSAEASGFIAVSKAEFDPESLTQIEFSGLSLIVGKMADASVSSPEAAGAVVAETSAKSDEAVAPDAPQSTKKFDYWDAEYSTGSTLSEVLTDAGRWSGLPIGMYELTTAMYTALNNALKDGADTSVVQQIVGEYAVRLELLAEASKGIPAAERTALFDAFGNRVIRSEAEEVTENTEIPAVTEETVEAEAAPETEEEAEQASAAADQQAVEEAAVAKSDDLAEVKGALESLTGSIAELVAAMKSDRENVEKLNGRLERVENAGQTRKSATPDESVQVKRSAPKVGGRGMDAF